MKYLLGVLILILFVSMIIYVSYQFTRSWNYHWAYKPRVEQTICELVKPEYLIKPC